MEASTICSRCGRLIELTGGDDDLVLICLGCLTMEEDIDDTLAIVTMLKVSAPDDPTGELPDITLDVVDAVLTNLERRLSMDGQVMEPKVRPLPSTSIPDVHRQPTEGQSA